MPHSSPKKVLVRHLTHVLDQLIDDSTPTRYIALLQKYHEADIAEALRELPIEKQLTFFKTVTPERAADILEDMDLKQQVEILNKYKTDHAAALVEEMDPDSAVDLLDELSETDRTKAEEIIDALPSEDAKGLKELLTYDDDTAGGIMTSQFLAIPENLTVHQALNHIRKQHPPNSEISFYIYVLDDQQRLIGFTTLQQLLMAEETQRVKRIRNDRPIYTTVTDDQEHVAKLIEKYDLIAIPVVDQQQRLVGLITVDDIVDVVIEEATEDIYKLSGTSNYDELKLIEGHMGHAIKSRLPWLILTILGGLIASSLITTFSIQFTSPTFSLAIILSFVPLLMGLGGNVGNQSATIMVRGISTGHVKTHHSLAYIFRETLIGLFIGIILGIVVFLFTQLFHQQMVLSLIVSLSMMVNITVAACLGSSLPIIFDKLNIDPAIASAPFISTTLDIIGQMIYFTLTLLIIANLT